MSTTITVPTAVLQDLIRIQGDELLRLRKQLEESSKSNERLSKALDDARAKIDRLEAGLTAPRPVENCGDLESSGEALDLNGSGDDSDTELNDSANEKIDANFDASSTARLDSPDPLLPFCSKQAPYKLLKQVRGVLEIKKGPTFLVTAQEFLVEMENPNNGTLILPLHHYLDNSKGTRLKDSKIQKPKGWPKFSAKDRELIFNRRGSWFYLGTYRPTSMDVLNAEDFECLPVAARKAVYKATAGSTKQNNVIRDVPLKYTTGELKAASITLRRVAFDKVIYDSLHDAGLSAATD